MFGRQILRKIFELIQSKDGWRIRSNNESQKLIKRKYVVKYKKQRVKRGGHIQRLKGVILVKKKTDWNSIRVRIKGRPKKRWREEVMNGLKKLKLRI